MIVCSRSMPSVISIAARQSNTAAELPDCTPPRFDRKGPWQQTGQRLGHGQSVLALSECNEWTTVNSILFWELNPNQSSAGSTRFASLSDGVSVGTLVAGDVQRMAQRRYGSGAAFRCRCRCTASAHGNVVVYASWVCRRIHCEEVKEAETRNECGWLAGLESRTVVRFRFHEGARPGLWGRLANPMPRNLCDAGQRIRSVYIGSQCPTNSHTQPFGFQVRGPCATVACAHICGCSQRTASCGLKASV